MFDGQLNAVGSYAVPPEFHDLFPESFFPKAPNTFFEDSHEKIEHVSAETEGTFTTGLVDTRSTASHGFLDATMSSDLNNSLPFDDVRKCQSSDGSNFEIVAISSLSNKEENSGVEIGLSWAQSGSDVQRSLFIHDAAVASGDRVSLPSNVIADLRNALEGVKLPTISGDKKRDRDGGDSIGEEDDEPADAQNNGGSDAGNSFEADTRDQTESSMVLIFFLVLRTTWYLHYRISPSENATSKGNICSQR